MTPGHSAGVGVPHNLLRRERGRESDREREREREKEREREQESKDGPDSVQLHDLLVTGNATVEDGLTDKQLPQNAA